jgi:1-acyl-sn-glycerol-3-phosphate acyltransferase
MTMVKLTGDSINSRKNWVFWFAKTVSVCGYRLLTKPHVEIPGELVRLKKEKSVLLYASLHKSLWETTGMMVSLHLNKLPIPYAGMGDNLIHGGFFRSLAKKTGVFLVKRAVNRSEMLESAKMLKEAVINYIAHGKDVILFPEGTRKSVLNSGQYGKFFPTLFEALLEYERIKEEIPRQYPGLDVYNTYIVPANVDYSKIREDLEMLEEYKGKPPTLHVLDSLKMLKNIQEAYISYGEPIKVADHITMNRKELAAYTREKCLELVKILPINIVSRAIMDSVDGDGIDTASIPDNISRNIQKLIHLKDRFRGFAPEDDPAVILGKVTRYESHFKLENIDIKNLVFYRLYANYIGHYFAAPPAE